MGRLEQIVFITGFLLCGFVCTPIALDQSLMTRHLIWAIFTFLLIIIITARAIENPRSVNYSVLDNRIFYALGAYLIFNCISALFAANRAESAYEILKVFLMITYLFCAMIIVDRDIFSKTCCLLGIGLGLYGIYQYVTSHYHPLECYGLMGSKNLWSSAQFLLLPFCLYSLKFKRWRIPAALASLLIVSNIVFLYVRAVYLTLFIFSASLLTLKAKRHLPSICKKAWANKGAICKWAILSALPAFVIGAVLITGIVRSPKYREIKKGLFGKYGLLNTNSMNERQNLWHKTAKMGIENPLTGVGAGNWKIEAPRFKAYNLKDDEFLKKSFGRPHNDFLWVFAELGIFGLAAYLSIFAIALFHCYRRREYLLFSLLLGYMTIASLSFPKERAFHTIMLLTVIALSHPRVKRPYRLSMARIYIASVIVLAVLGLTIINFALRFKADICSRRLWIAKRAGNWSAILSEQENYSRWANIRINGFGGLSLRQGRNRDSEGIFSGCFGNISHA
jgi:O-antigen ligase